MRDRINVFIFRRDLRVVDNLAFSQLVMRSKEDNIPLLPIFIFHPDQIDPRKNKYFSKNCVEFMIQSLESLSYDLRDRLVYFHGNDIDVLEKISGKYRIHCLGFNEDFTPYARKRDSLVQQWCKKNDISLITSQDYTLFSMGTILKDDRTPYEVFTPFYRRCLANIETIAKPLKKPPYTEVLVPNASSLSSLAIHNIHDFYRIRNPHLAVKGGRDAALAILRRIQQGEFKEYDKERDYPSKDKTTKLSAYMKFGCVSVREVFHTIVSKYGANHGLAREIIWREFYANITYHFPHILQGQVSTKKNGAFKEKYNGIKWNYDKTAFAKWCAGATGVPLVDAAMRQMNETGWMHNRCRMVVSMFLTKDLHIDWKMGEKYFAQTLVDYDPSSNNGGWQWSASTGVDSQPYFRIFNPFVQSKRFDPDAEYIKRWVPELQEVPSKDIHEWNKAHLKYGMPSYPKPMVDHVKEVKETIKLFRV